MRAVRPVGNPLLSIWLFPRDTVRHILATNPGKHVIGLAGATGLAAALARHFTAGSGPDHSWLANLIVGGLGSLAGIYVMAWIVGAVARRLGCEASAVELRAALAWSALPLILASLSSLVVPATLNALAATSGAPVATAVPLPAPYAFFDRLLPAAFRLWALALQVICSSEVLHLDKRRACLVLLLAYLLYAPIMLILHWLHYLVAAAVVVFLFRRVYAGCRTITRQDSAKSLVQQAVSVRPPSMAPVRTKILIALAGIGVTWSFLTWDQSGRASPWQLLPYALVGGPVLGWLLLYGESRLLLLIGARLGGKGTIAQVQAALGRSALFLLPLLLLPLLVICLFPLSGKAGLLCTAQAGPVLYVLLLAVAASILPLVPSLARVFRFPMWRAATAVLLAPALTLLLAAAGTLGLFIIVLY